MVSNKYMEQQNRPLSPHLGIYKPQISSVLSILHRIASFISLLGLMELVFTCVYIINNPHEDAKWIIDFYSAWYGKALLMAWTYAFAFYLCTEIRYMLWSFGMGFEIKQFTTSGYVAVAASVSIWVIFWFIIFR